MPYTIITFFLFLLSTTYSDHHICSQTAQCENRTITCSSGQPCYVECSGNWSCHMTVVECPEFEECHIKCFYDETDYNDNTDYTSYLTCYNMTILALSSSVLTINASFPNISEHQYIRIPKEGEGVRWPRTMDYTTIYCPNPIDSPTGSANKCKIYCDGDSLMRNVDINAVRGTADILIESKSYDYDTCIRETTLYCTNYYNRSCPLSTAAPFQCQDYANRIPDTTCEFATMSPTLLPTNNPTVDTTSPTFTSTLTTTVITTSPTMSPLIKTTNQEFKISDPERGLSDTDVILAVFFPCLCCTSLCVGFGIWFMRKSKRRKHSPISAEEEYEDEEYGKYRGTLNTGKDGIEEDVDEDSSRNTDDSSTGDYGVSEQMLRVDAETNEVQNEFISHAIGHSYSRDDPTDSGSDGQVLVD